MVLSQPMQDAGWTVSVLMDTGSLRTQVKTAMIAIILCLCLAAALIAAMLQRRRRLRERLTHQAEAQAELERRVESARPIWHGSIRKSNTRSPSDARPKSSCARCRMIWCRRASWRHLGRCRRRCLTNLTSRWQPPRTMPKTLASGGARASGRGDGKSQAYFRPDRPYGVDQQTSQELCPQAQRENGSGGSGNRNSRYARNCGPAAESRRCNAGY